ncbi:hypothetical protein FBUS_08068 [Fasciolopsis buskii]|uniref:Uncharacterized protein n=1 Tax=Fasciolopsis buskii TaxID=27845 RepID=A0A8E0S580_9TREM|nr:hypothetical protein FBUS_08068 [Fasciolopsis buski]
MDESLAFPTSISAGSPPTSTGAFRRSGMLRSSIFESTRSNIVQSDSEKEDNPDPDITAKAETSSPNESKSIPSKANVTTSTASCELAALPGPFEFFARFHGLRPWRQPQPSESPTPPGSFKRSRSTATLSGATNFAQITSPMRIDRYEVDTGQMTPSLWVSHLRRQFAELASPRNHVWYVFFAM